MVARTPGACRAQGRSHVPLGCRSRGMAGQRGGSHSLIALGALGDVEGDGGRLGHPARPSGSLLHGPCRGEETGALDPSPTGPGSPRSPRLPRFPRLPRAAGLRAGDGAGAATGELEGRRERGVRGVKPGPTLGPAQAGVRKEGRADGAVPPPRGFRPPPRDPSGQARSLRGAVQELAREWPGLALRGHVGAKTSVPRTVFPRPVPSPPSPAVPPPPPSGPAAPGAG